MRYFAKSSINHNGQMYNTGDELALNDEQAKNLVEADVIEVRDDGDEVVSASEAFPAEPVEATGRELVTDEPEIEEAAPAPEAPAEDIPLAPTQADSDSSQNSEEVVTASPEVTQETEQTQTDQPTEEQIAETLNSLETSADQSSESTGR